MTDPLAPLPPRSKRSEKDRVAKRKAARIIVGKRPLAGAPEAEKVAWRKRSAARKRQKTSLAAAATVRHTKKVVRQLNQKTAPRVPQKKRPPVDANYPEDDRRVLTFNYRVTPFQRTVIDARLVRAGAGPEFPRRAGSWLREVALGYESAWPVVQDTPLPEGWDKFQPNVDYRKGCVMMRLVLSAAEKAELEARSRAAGHKYLGSYVRDLQLLLPRNLTSSHVPLRAAKRRKHRLVDKRFFGPRRFKDGKLTSRRHKAPKLKPPAAAEHAAKAPKPPAAAGGHAPVSGFVKGDP